MERIPDDAKYDPEIIRSVVTYRKIMGWLTIVLDMEPYHLAPEDKQRLHWYGFCRVHRECRHG